MAPLRQFANHPDPMDLWLESQGYYRKITAKDGSSLFRAIAEQIYHTQRYHMEVRQECIDYLREHPSIFLEFKLEESVEEYLQNLLNPTMWGGPIEIAAFSMLYKVNILVFKEVAVHPRIENQEFNRTIMLCSSQERHYDSVYLKDYTKVAGFCQSIVYEVLYKDVFKMKDVSYAVEKMLHYKIMRHRNDVGLCSPRKYLNFNCSSAQFKQKVIEDTPDSEVNVRELLSKGITPFPYKVAKSLDPSILRNVEFDVWVDFRRGLRFGYFDSTSELRVGVKCRVKLADGESYVGHIQEMADDKGPVVLFVEDIGEIRTVPYECLELHPQESPPAKPWSFSFHGQKFATSKQTSPPSEQSGKGRKGRDGGDGKSGGSGSSKNAQLAGGRSRNRKMSNAVCEVVDGSEVSPQQATSLMTYNATTSPDTYLPYSSYQVETDMSTGIPLVVDRSLQYPILTTATATTPLSRQSPLLLPLSPSTDDMACRYAPFSFASDANDSSRMDVTSSNGPICPTDYFHFVPYDFVESPSDFSEVAEPGTSPKQSSKDCNFNYMSNDQWKPQSPINFNAPKSILEDGADLPLSDFPTLRFFYNLGNDVYRAQCSSWNSPSLYNSVCASSFGPLCNVASGSGDFSDKLAKNASSDSTINSQDASSATAGSRRKRRDTTVSSPGGVSMSSDSETGGFVPRIANAAPSPSSSQSQCHLPPRFKRDNKSGGKAKCKDFRAEDAPASVPTSTAPSLSSKRIGDSSTRLEPLVLGDPSVKDSSDGMVSPAVTVPYGYVCYPNMAFSPVVSDPNVPIFPSCRVQYPDFVSDGRPQCYSPVSDVGTQYPVYAQSSHFIFPASPGIYVGTPTWAAMTPPTPQ